MRYVQISNQNRPLADKLEAGYCSSFICRLRGLTFRRNLDKDQGLLLVESTEGRLQTAIHMVFVFFPIGAVWINDRGEVVDARLAKPWVSFIIPAEPARYVLEIHPDRLAEFQIGDVVRFE